MKYQELTNNERYDRATYSTTHAKTGKSRDKDGKIINGILFVLTVGCRWDEIPEKYGSKSTAHLRLQNWQQKGAWKKIYLN